ncbi:MAG: hypothetical protein AB7E85_08240 [Pseudobdellovibrionaceae bacterium]
MRIKAEENRKSFDELSNKENCARIFVEGESDRIILGALLKTFKQSHFDSLLIETKTSGAGHAYVIDMLHHWRRRHKHHQNEAKAIGIVDEDAAGEKKQWNQEPNNTNSAKCFIWPKPQSFIDLDRTILNASLSLETLYPKDIWVHAEENEWLEEIKPLGYLKEDYLNKIVEEEKRKGDFITDTTPLFVTHNVRSDKKISLAKYVANKPSNYLRQNFGFMSDFFDQIITYLEV